MRLGNHPIAFILRLRRKRPSYMLSLNACRFVLENALCRDYHGSKPMTGKTAVACFKRVRDGGSLIAKRADQWASEGLCEPDRSAVVKNGSSRNRAEVFVRGASSS